MGKNRVATSSGTSGPDAGTQTWIDRYRQIAADRYNQQNGTPTTGPLAQYGQTVSSLAGQLPYGMERGLGGIDAYQDPYQKDVVAATQGDFQRQRDLALRTGADQATQAGAYGGSRSGVLQANLIGDVNRNEASTLADIRSRGFSDAAARLQADRERAANLGLAGTQGLLGYGQYLDTRGQNALDQYARGLQFGGQQYSTSERPAYNDFQDLLSIGVSAIPGIGGLLGKKKAAA